MGERGAMTAGVFRGEEFEARLAGSNPGPSRNSWESEEPGVPPSPAGGDIADFGHQLA